ncbi:vitamin-D-receptor interacting mediator subunit 4-domain-containing protein [Phyllosticta citrichinensis]|uniref:Mediator of RNA polymerase II transcription subunit 4 n=1 Tax=Phyllosticta citrichinensis TaxID=1130410 RepID=A0ABR1XHN7_9PEZI
MDALLDARFQRVESALNTLIDSIASYNPSQSAVLDLVAADEDLSRRLEQLAIHQANYRRILSLRQAADTLDAQIKSTLGTLAETRKELVALPITTASPSARHVSTDELLSYAKHIGKFTAPPGTKPPPSLDPIPRPEEKPDTDVNMTNGGGTDPQPQPQGGAADAESKTMAALSQEQKAWLAGLSNLQFVPWPTDDKIKLGALGQIQAMVEQGKDPTTVLSIEEQEERAKKAAEEEEERRTEEEKRKAEAEQRRRESQPSAPNRGEAQGEQPAVFGGLDLY